MTRGQILPALRSIWHGKADVVRSNDVRHELLSSAELLQLAASACRVDARKERTLTAGDLAEAARQAIKHAIDHVGDEQLTEVRLGLLRLHSLLLVVQGALARTPGAGDATLTEGSLADTLEIGVELAYSLAGRLSTLTRDSAHPAAA